jgi:hypothetical protein
LLSNSCTINIVRYTNAAGRVGRFDIRHLFNGLTLVRSAMSVLTGLVGILASSARCSGQTMAMTNSENATGARMERAK